MLTTTHSIRPLPRQSAADVALAAAVDRFLPNPEALDEWARDRVGEFVA